MKKTTFLIAVAALLALPAFSQSGKTEKMKHLISLMHIDKTIDQTFEQLVTSSAAQLKAVSNADEATQKIAAEKMEKTMEISRKLAKLLANDMVDIYGKFYTEEDVDVLIQFYESPTGKKTIEMQPKMVGEMMNLMNTKYMPQMLKEMEAVMKE